MSLLARILAEVLTWAGLIMAAPGALVAAAGFQLGEYLDDRELERRYDK